MRLSGTVIRGQGFATIAFGLPTANLEFDDVVNLEPGVYVGYAYVGQDRYAAVIYSGPQGSEKFEAHLFDYSGDLYGQNLEIETIKMISQHIPWESEEQMRAKVAADIQLARDYFSTAS